MTGHFLQDLRDELAAADAAWAPIHSAHEGYGVLAEEVEEFWEEVRKKRANRDLQATYCELVQVAAVAWRIARDLGYADVVRHKEDHGV